MGTTDCVEFRDARAGLECGIMRRPPASAGGTPLCVGIPDTERSKSCGDTELERRCPGNRGHPLNSFIGERLLDAQPATPWRISRQFPSGPSLASAPSCLIWPVGRGERECISPARGPTSRALIYPCLGGGYGEVRSGDEAGGSLPGLKQKAPAARVHHRRTVLQAARAAHQCCNVFSHCCPHELRALPDSAAREA